jgi:hypothetical protein
MKGKACYYTAMARPKRVTQTPVSTSTSDLVAQIEEACGPITAGGKDFKYNPVIQLAVFAAGATDADDAAMKKLRLEAAKEVAKYTNTQVRATELSGPKGGEIKIRIMKPDEA